MLFTAAGRVKTNSLADTGEVVVVQPVIPVELSRVAEVTLSPVGATHVGVAVELAAVVQYWKRIDPRLLPAGTERPKLCLTRFPAALNGAEPPTVSASSVRLRAVI